MILVRTENFKLDEEMMKHCGRYPVIFLTLKDVKCNTWEETYELLKELIRIDILGRVIKVTSVL